LTLFHPILFHCSFDSCCLPRDLHSFPTRRSSDLFVSLDNCCNNVLPLSTVVQLPSISNCVSYTLIHLSMRCSHSICAYTKFINYIFSINISVDSYVL